MKHKLEIFYSVSNGGDGSAYPLFTLTEELAYIHQESQEWGEPCVGSLMLESDSPITLVNKNLITKESLLEDLEECEETEENNILELKERLRQL